MQNRLNKISLSFLFLSVAVLLTISTVNPALAKPNDALPPDAMAAIAEAISKDLPASYDIEKVADGYAAENRNHKLKMSFSKREIRFCKSDSAWSYAFTLTGIGYNALKKPPPAEIVARGNRIELRRGRALTEWYLNTPFGIEQGFTLNNPPADRDKNSWLRLELTLQGPLDAVLQDDRTVIFKNSSGKTVTRYAGLYVTDADKKSLPARLEIDNGNILLLADDSDARYPVTVDPWIQQAAKLNASNVVAHDQFGYSVAVSGDTAIVGAYVKGTSKLGSAYVFVKPASGWSGMTQTARLTASDEEGGDGFGCSVAVSGDTVIVGARRKNEDAGSAYVFVKPAGGWSDMTQTAKLTASDAENGDWFGSAVAISSDTAVVGAPNDDVAGFWSGSAYVFERDNGGLNNWGQTAKLTAGDVATEDWFGESVAVSGDTAVVGARGDDDAGSMSGSAYVFVKGGGWSDMTQTAKLIASDTTAGDQFGYSVAVSGDTVIVGARRKNEDAGSAYVFEKGTGWTHGSGNQAAKLTRANETDFSSSFGLDYFGTSVAINGDTVIVGAHRAASNLASASGLAYVFIKPEDGWSDMTQTDQLFSSDAAHLDYFGCSVAVSGVTAIVGAYGNGTEDGIGDGNEDLNDDKTDSGSAYVFELGTDPGTDPDPTPAPVPEPPPVPTVADVTLLTTSGPYPVGTVIPIAFNFNYSVWVKGIPSLALNTGGPVPVYAWYSGGSGTKIITFEYTVAPGDDITKLDYWSEWALELNSGQIYSNQGIDVDLDLPVPGEPGSLGYNNTFSVLSTAYPVYRFYSPGLSKHFFTTDENEKESLLANAADVWQLENAPYNVFLPLQYNAATQALKDTLVAVHRFYSAALQTHLYTADANEAAYLIAEAAESWQSEGPVFYVPAGNPEGAIPVYRFYSESLKVHLFTADENEKNHLIDNAGDVWRFEGIAYYAYP